MVDKQVKQYQVEMPLQPIMRCFTLEVGHCKHCRKRIQGRHALQTSDAIGAASSQVGPTLQAFLVVLNKQMGLSYGKISSLLKQAFGITLSRAAVWHIIHRVALGTQDDYEQLRARLKDSPVIHIDETGWKVGGDLNWLWTFVTPEATVYVIRPFRSGIVVEEQIGEQYKGKLGHDGWSAYDRFLKATHQQCLFHGLRRCKVILKKAKGSQRQFAQKIQRLFLQGLAARDRLRLGLISPRGALICKGRLEAQLKKEVQKHRFYEPNRRFAKHLKKHHGQWFNFLKYPDLLGATNNLAERAIRPAVVNRKVWGGNRTEEGAETQSVLTSVLETLKRHRCKPLEFLGQVVKGMKPKLFSSTTMAPT